MAACEGISRRGWKAQTRTATTARVPTPAVRADLPEAEAVVARGGAATAEARAAALVAAEARAAVADTVAAVAAAPTGAEVVDTAVVVAEAVVAAVVTTNNSATRVAGLMTVR